MKLLTGTTTLESRPQLSYFAGVDIKQLRFLTALAQHEHFGRAADACHVSQPTLSARIRQLEEEFGLPLVDRAQHTFHGLTEEGERVLQWARRIVADCDAMRQDVDAMSGELRGSLTIGFIPTALSYSPQLTQPFHQAHPNVLVSVLTRSSQQIQRGLDHYEIDAGVTYIGNEPLKNARVLPLYDERYELVTARGSQLAESITRNQTVSWKQAARYPLLMLTPDMQYRRILDRAFASCTEQPVPVLQTNSITGLCAQLLESQAATVLPNAVVSAMKLETNVVSTPLVDPDFTQAIGLACADRNPTLPVVNALYEIARKLTQAPVNISNEE